MKQFKGFILLFISFFHLVGFYIGMEGLIYRAKSEIKKTIKKGIPAASMHNFALETISKDASFKWEKENKEFWYKGHMYDIVRTNVEGIMYCIDDIQECQLFENLSNLVTSYFGNSKKGKHEVNNFLAHFCFEYMPAKPIEIPKYYGKLISKFHIGIFISSPLPTIEINSPPPQFLV